MLPNRTALLNSTCIIQKKTVTQDEFGHPQESYTNEPPISCRARELSATETPKNGQLANIKITRFYITSNVNITESDRIIWNDKIYEVININLLSLQKGLTQGIQVDVIFISKNCNT